MNKVVIITGASRGIGREVAKLLVKDGNNVIAGYNNSENEGISLKEELKIEGYNIDIFKANVSVWEECSELVKFVLNKYGRIDVLINNAGISQIKEFTKLTAEDWNKMINVNLNSVFYMTKEVVENMIHNKCGSIINISSVWGMVGASCETIYAISKAGMDAMTKSLAKELGPSNIRVNSIAPGATDTDMNKNLTQKEIEELNKEIPLGRMGTTTDIAKCVNWLIEDEYTTGQIISINGGWIIT